MKPKTPQRLWFSAETNGRDGWAVPTVPAVFGVLSKCGMGLS